MHLRDGINRRARFLRVRAVGEMGEVNALELSLDEAVVFGAE